MDLHQVSGGAGAYNEGLANVSTQAKEKQPGTTPLSTRIKALGSMFAEVGVGKISLGIAKLVGGIIIRNTAKILPEGQTKDLAVRKSKELKHSAIQTAAKTATAYMSGLMERNGWSVSVPLMNIAKHQQVSSQPWSKPADTEAAEALMDGMLDNHVIREDRTHPLARMGLARAKVRESMKEAGIEESDIQRALREPRSNQKAWNETVNKLHSERDAVLQRHGVNDPRTSTIVEVIEAQTRLEAAQKVKLSLDKLVTTTYDNAKEAPKSSFIRLTETPKGQDIQRSGNLHYRHVNSSKLTAVRDGICFGSCIRWATQYNALPKEAKGEGKGLNAMEEMLRTVDQEGMDVQATANQLTYQSLYYSPKIDFVRADAGRKSINDVLDAVKEIALQAGWVLGETETAAFVQDLQTVLSLYKNGRGPTERGSLYDALAGKQDSPFRQSEYWKNSGNVPDKNAQHFVHTVLESLGEGADIHNCPLLKDRTLFKAAVELAVALESGKTGDEAIKEVTNKIRQSELTGGYFDIKDKKVSKFIAEQRGYTYQPQTDIFGVLAQAKSNQQFLTRFNENFSKLEDGFYHFDINCGKNGAHSMAVVKEGDEVMFIDPNLGAIRAKGGDAATKLLGDVLKMYNPVPKSRKRADAGDEPFHAPRLALAKPL